VGSFARAFPHLSQRENCTVPEENAYFAEKVLPSATENYKSKGAKVEFRA
jgi:hypothetical protein